MRRLNRLTVYLFVLFAAESAVFFVLPSLHIPIYLSPDETAVARSAQRFGEAFTMRIPDPILRTYPWVHPRSMVTQGDAMVPVGFLGFPLLLGLLWRIVHGSGLLYVTPILAVSAAYPLWRFSKKTGVIGQVAAVSVWLSFPSVILYANRGLFPNLPVVCLMLWAAWLMWEHRSWMRSAGAGLLFALAMAIRPVEAVWAVPWMIAAWRSRPGAVVRMERKDVAAFCAATAIVLVCALAVARATYGDPFAIGYALRDPLAVDARPSVGGVSSVIPGWPFGLHPKDVFFNLRAYLAGFLAPWTLCGILAIIAWHRKGNRTIMLVAGWTFIALCAMYAGSIYQDHVGINVTSLGNSFLRYTLPLAPFFAFSVGSIVAWLGTRMTREHARTFAVLLTALLFLFGTWTAFRRDDEGIEADSRQLRSYATILSLAKERLPPETIILSERSDKIFFPDFRVASPVPDAENLLRLVQDGRYPVAFFGLSADLHDGQRVYAVGNMTMFLLRDATSSTRP